MAKKYDHGKGPDGDKDGATGSHRRISRVVHDERGSARIEWIAAPEDDTTPRPILILEGEEPLSLEGERDPAAGMNPYDNSSPVAPRSAGDGATRRDLRKLSEWIKLKRTLEERKRDGEDDGD